MPRYDARRQFLAYHFKMMRNRIDGSKIIPTEEKQTELMRLGALLDHNVSDVLHVIKLMIYR